MYQAAGHLTSAVAQGGSPWRWRDVAFMRTVQWAYTRLALPLVFKGHAPERMWRRGSLYERIGAEVLYRLAWFDELIKSLPLGTTWVVKARKV